MTGSSTAEASLGLEEAEKNGDELIELLRG
jgi:hypothetical protein